MSPTKIALSRGTRIRSLGAVESREFALPRNGQDSIRLAWLYLTIPAYGYLDDLTTRTAFLSTLPTWIERSNNTLNTEDNRRLIISPHSPALEPHVFFVLHRSRLRGRGHTVANVVGSFSQRPVYTNSLHGRITQILLE